MSRVLHAAPARHTFLHQVLLVLALALSGCAIAPDRPAPTLPTPTPPCAPTWPARRPPVPTQNATGNFTKIVQRLPVRIALEPGQEDAARLRVGMSVQPRIALEDGRAPEDVPIGAWQAPPCALRQAYRIGTPIPTMVPHGHPAVQRPRQPL